MQMTFSLVQTVSRLSRPDKIAARFAPLEELKKAEIFQNINKVEALKGNAFECDESGPFED